MSDLTDLYQEVILDHNRRPRNFREMGEANRRQEGYNPLCGDRLTLYVKLDGDRISDVSFQGTGCAILEGVRVADDRGAQGQDGGRSAIALRSLPRDGDVAS
jgi:hypothetical protein